MKYVGIQLRLTVAYLSTTIYRCPETQYYLTGQLNQSIAK